MFSFLPIWSSVTHDWLYSQRSIRVYKIENWFVNGCFVFGRGFVQTSSPWPVDYFDSSEFCIVQMVPGDHIEGCFTGGAFYNVPLPKNSCSKIYKISYSYFSGGCNFANTDIIKLLIRNCPFYSNMHLSKLTIWHLKSSLECCLEL